PTDLPALMQDAPADAVLRLRRLLELAELGDEWADLDDDERLDRLERIVGDDPGEAEERSRSLGDLLSAVWSVDDEGSEAETTDDAGSADDAEGEGTSGAETEASDAESTATEGETSDADSPDAADDPDAAGDADEGDEEGEEGGTDDQVAAFRENLGRLQEKLQSMAEQAADETEDEDENEDEEDAADAQEGTAADDDPDELVNAEEDEDEGGRAPAGRRSRFSTMPSSRSDMGRSTRFSTMRGRK
ncbi:hypothetical protein ACFQE1_06920, partial [Halobium palmae]